MTDFNIVEELKEITSKLDILDTYLDSLGDLQSNVDMKLSDLYHYIENNTLKTNEAYRIVKEIKEQRKLRRKYKQEYELLKTYREDIQRLNSIDNRKFLMTGIYKTQKSLNTKYKNRVYTDEELKIILGGKKNDMEII